MSKTNSKPKVTVSKSGVRQVPPAEIFRSEIGRERIRRMASSIAGRVRTTTSRGTTDE